MIKGSNKLTARGIQGMFYRAYESAQSPLLSDLTLHIASDQKKEDYAWLGMAPGMKKRIGGLNVTKLREFGYTIVNDEYDNSLEFDRFDIEHDKTGQVRARIAEFAARAKNHPLEMVLSLVAGAEAGICYDSQYFFDTDHSEGDSGAQSNLLPVTKAGTVPTAGEMETAILKTVEQLLSLKDDNGDPVNEYAQKFRVIVPVSLFSVAGAALKNPIIVDGSASRTNSIATNVGGFEFALSVSPRLSSWSNKFAIFRTDGTSKPFIYQDLDDVEVQTLGEDSDYFVKNNKYLLKVRAARGAGYGFWQYGCMGKF